MTPRRYQSDVVHAVLAGFGQFNRQLVVLPTGSGKTLIFSWIAQAVLPKRTLILAHREELIDQAIDKLHRATGLFAGREKAESTASRSDNIVVASVQSMIRRLAHWPANHFGLLVADEAHHSISNSWQRVLNHFDGSAWVLGVTATPDRGDHRNLGTYFENVAAEIPLFDLVHQGHLCRIAIQTVPLRINLAGVRQTAGDYNESDLGAALDPYLDQIADQIADRCAFRRTLAFLPLIATSKKFTAACASAGLRAEHVDGTSFDRTEILARFAAGDIDLLSNAMLLTEGYDCPQVDCVVCLRPTRSRPLYAQQVGRGTRVAPGKANLLLLDFLWLHERHSLIRPAHLIAKCDREADEMTEVAETNANSQELLDLEGLATETQISREQKLAEELRAKAKRKGRWIDATEFALAAHARAAIDYEPSMRWELDPVSQGQAAVLERMGIDLESVSCKGHASKLLDALINRSKSKLCTPKQMRMLQRFNHPNPAGATFDEARAFLDRRIGGRKEVHV